MFRYLRLRLTLLYLGVALLLILGIGATAYFLLQDNFRSAVDLALQHRVALALGEIGEPLPAALEAEERTWYAERGEDRPSSAEDAGENGEAENGEPEDDAVAPTASIPSPIPLSAWQTHESEFDAELSPITLAAVRTDGGVVSLTGGVDYNLDPEIVARAIQSGSDIRTVANPNGHPVRLFTLRVDEVPGYLVLQAGRSLEDQGRLLADLLSGLLQWGVVFVFLMGAGSWWLSGRALRSAQRAWEKQQAFVAHAGHELRTPLTIIRASAEVAQRRLPGGDDRRGILSDIIDETAHMSRLVEDLLLLSRLDAGAVKVQTRPLALAPFLRQTLEAFARVAEARGVTLNPPREDATVLADEDKLRQVVLILLDNALRHSPTGEAIGVDLARAGRSVRITVRDRGQGIPPEEMAHVFDRFFRGRGEAAESGSGLGLSIARELTELMRGKIRIESDPGRGTTVTIELPAADPNSRPLETE